MENILENIKDNLDTRICDCLEGATNTETYREFIIGGWEDLNMPLTEEEKASLDSKTNEELNNIVDELDWLLSK